MHHIWYTSADSSVNGHRLNTIRPSTLGGGGLGGHKLKNQGKIQTAGPIGTNFVDSSGKGYTPNKLPRETQGGTWGGGGGGCLGGKQSNVRESCQTAGPIGTNFGSHLRIHLGMGIG